jgi:hypothetical protein
LQEENAGKCGLQWQLFSGKLLFNMAKKKNAAAVSLGSLGGKARKKNLTPEERSEIARTAGKAGGRGRKKP